MLAKQLDAQGEKMDAKLDALGQKLDVKQRDEERRFKSAMTCSSDGESYLGEEPKLDAKLGAQEPKALEALAQQLNAQGQNLNALGQRLDTKLDALEQKLEAQGEAGRARLLILTSFQQAQAQKVDALAQKLDAQGETLDRVCRFFRTYMIVCQCETVITWLFLAELCPPSLIAGAAAGLFGNEGAV